MRPETAFHSALPLAGNHPAADCGAVKKGGGRYTARAAPAHSSAPSARRALNLALAASALALAGASLASAWDGIAPEAWHPAWHAAPPHWDGAPAPGPHPLLPAAYASHESPCNSNAHNMYNTNHYVLATFVSPDGSYKIGDTVRIRVVVDRPTLSNAPTAFVEGHLRHTSLELETGDTNRFALYEHGSAVNGAGGASGHADYIYTVEPGDYSDDLDYASADALHWRLGSFDMQVSGLGANCHLSTPGTSDYDGRPSLSVGGNVTVDGIVPRVANVTVAPPGEGYGLGDRIEFGVNFNETVVYSGAAPALLLNLSGGETRSADYASGNNSATLVFAYAVKPGDDAPDVEYNGTAALTTAGGVSDLAGNPANLSLSASGSLGRAGPIPIDATRPAVVSVSSPNGTGPHTEGAAIAVRVSFSEDVAVDEASGAPSIALDTGAAAGSAGRYALYDADASTDRTLAFSYAVQEGDETAGLAYASAAALSGNGGTIRDAAGNMANLTLDDPGEAGPLAGASGPIRLDAKRPAVVSVSSPNGTGPHTEGAAIAVRVSFSEDVAVDEASGAPSIALDTGAAAGSAGRYALYDADASTDRTLAFSYAVQEGDETAGLAYASAAALSGNGGTIRDAAGNMANLTLDDPGEAGPLAGASGPIRLDAKRPAVVSVSSPNASGAYGAGSMIAVHAEFSEDVAVDEASGTPSIALNAGTAGYDAAASTARTLAFVYTAAEGDGTDDLGYADSAALSPNMGTIRDAAGNEADVTLPDPGGNGLLGQAGAIRIDTESPTVVSVSSPNASGAYAAGDAVHIEVEFSEAVDVEGAPVLELETGRIDRHASYASGSGAAVLTFLYEVRAGDDADVLGYAGTDALSAGGGAIRDEALNPADLDLPDAGSPMSLHASSIEISTGGGGGMGGAGNASDATVVLGPDGGAAYSNLTAGGNGVRVTINVAGLAGAGAAGGTVQFPPGGAVVETSFASVSFPPGATAESVPAGGLLVLHVVPPGGLPPESGIQGLAYDGSGAVLLRDVVEIGDGAGVVTFDMPVRISLEGQAGGRAFYIDGGSGGAARPIDAACAADDTERVHRHLNGTGECRIDSDDGVDMVIYTYHLTRFGTVGSESGAPPPVYHTCSVGLGSQSLDIGEAAPGGRSDPAEQLLINYGSAPFAQVGIEASPWRAASGGGAPPGAASPILPDPAPGTGEGMASSALVARVYASVPAAATEVGEEGIEGAYAAVGEGTAVARGLGGGDAATLWFRLNLAPYDMAAGGVLVQTVSYNAQCSLP